MGFVPLIVVAAVAVGLAVAAILLALNNSKLKQQLEDAQLAYASLRDARAQVDSLRLMQGEAQRQLATVETEDRKKAEWLDHQEKEIEWLRQELEKRPKVTRKTYKILTLGISGTGKTALTLKWANPLVDLGTLQGTKIERYERTVSHVAGKDATIEHVFEVGDWGGEHIVDAQQELVMDEIHGLLMVVDLAAADAKVLDPGRIQLQLREFQPESLKFFFGPKTIASCKTIVLFINKSDVLAGTPADVEREARRLYQRLIDDLERFQQHLDVRVLVGSATYGHSTHHLFAHFVERILPKNAYDNQLLQRMKAEANQEASTHPLPPGRGGPFGAPAPQGVSTIVPPRAPGHLPQPPAPHAPPGGAAQTVGRGPNVIRR